MNDNSVNQNNVASNNNRVTNNQNNVAPNNNQVTNNQNNVAPNNNQVTNNQNIVAPNNNQVTNNKSKKSNFKLIAMIIFFLCVVVLIILLIINKNNESSTNKEDGTKENNFKKYTLFKMNDSQKKYYLIYEGDTLPESLEKIYTYSCNTDKCKVSSLNNDKYLLVYDKYLFLYDYNKNEKNSVNVDLNNANIDTIGGTMSFKDVDNVLALSYQLINNNSETKKIKMKSYLYSIDTKKVVFESDNYIDAGSVSLNNKTIIDGCKVRNVETGKVLHEFTSVEDESLNNNECIITIAETTEILYIEYNSINGNSGNIYDKNFNKIASYKDEINLLENGHILVSEGNLFKEYDLTGKVLKTSKKYDKVLLLLDKYFAAVDNGRLKLFSIDETELVDYASWNENTHKFIKGMSGYYTIDGIESIYLTVEDNSLEESKSGYEYYYILDTHETGKHDKKF